MPVALSTTAHSCDALRFQQFAQQTLILVLLGQGTIQLFGQIHDDLPQRLCIQRQGVRVDGHHALAYAETGPFPSKNNS